MVSLMYSRHRRPSPRHSLRSTSSKHPSLTHFHQLQHHNHASYILSDECNRLGMSCLTLCNDRRPHLSILPHCHPNAYPSTSYIHPDNSMTTVPFHCYWLQLSICLLSIHSTYQSLEYLQTGSPIHLPPNPLPIHLLHPYRQRQHDHLTTLEESYLLAISFNIHYTFQSSTLLTKM